MRQLSILFLIYLVNHSIIAQDKIGININVPQFNLDIRSTSELNPVELHLGNPGDTRFLRLFSGSSTFVHPAVYWKDAHDLRFATDLGGFSEKMRIQSNGRVGIGTPLPSGQLHIAYDSSIPYPQLRLTENANDFARIKLENTAFPNAYWDVAGNSDGNPDFARLNFFYSNGTSSGDRLTVMGNGNVGIGTTSPTSKLDIFASGDGVEILKLSTERPWVFKQTGTGINANLTLQSTINGKNFELLSSDGLTKAASFRLWNTDPSVILVPENGKVGIGLDNPSSILHVNGITTMNNRLEFINTENSIYIGDDAGLNTNSSSLENIGIGKYSLTVNDNGFGNVAVGFESMKTNDSGWLSTAIGQQSLMSNIDGKLNSGIGAWTLFHHTTGNENTAVGFAAMYGDKLGVENTAIGARAMENGKDGNQNTAVGFKALRENLGNKNVAIGWNSLQNNTIGIKNIAIGSGSMNDNVDGSNNLAVGNDALYKNIDGFDNIAIGSQAMLENKGDENIAIGIGAMLFNISGNKNTVLGTKAGLGVSGQSYSGNVFIGYEAGKNETNSNRLYIDNSSTSAPLIYGEFNNNFLKVNGSLDVTGTLSKSSGTFKIDHPLDPANKYLYHSFVESPDMMNVYNGNITTDENGKAVVKLPDYFEELNKDFRYQLTVIGTFAQAIVSKKIKRNQFEIMTDQPMVEVSWQVTGVRNDPYARENRILVEVEKEAHNKGTYIYPTYYRNNHK